ncbi:SLAP domain-containing protein [Companilactobacillus versmoldensis]|uniref:Teichoic acid-binding N-acetylmuramoyl L-alalanine amidase n=1 Tax=Companilactobacillus versmoldensis DSM 14857 = KCTC 3814 TaxID=1423815 RepID=A0A0R1SF35_9LACO|nr:SLAP domain-containing protein [Companilactobacillus versmoldensis]KRL67353.1 teichoic acid-binding N-acetylmuramoyl L-alalanine amidase [Companilactobacillus versmoldensis DSM 14857 = KCTC 3814]
MKKNRILLALALTALIAPSILGGVANDFEPTVKAATTTNINSFKNPVGTVDLGGAYTVDADGNQTSLFLPGQSAWKLGPSILINGETYYEVATNNYIGSDRITVSDGVPFYTIIHSAVPNQVGTLTTDSQVVDSYGNDTGTVLPAGSSWKLGQLIKISGLAYYQVSANGYVLAAFLTTDTAPATDGNDTITLNNASEVLDDNGSRTGRILPAYSSWKTDQTKTLNGLTYYRVGTNQWVSNVPIADYSLTAKLKNSQSVYNSKTNSMTRSLPAGSSWEINKVVRNKNNQFWGKVSNDEWLLIDANNVVMSYGDSDTVPNVAISEPDFATNINNQ